MLGITLSKRRSAENKEFVRVTDSNGHFIDIYIYNRKNKILCFIEAPKENKIDRMVFVEEEQSWLKGHEYRDYKKQLEES